MVTERVGRMRLIDVKKNGEWTLKGVQHEELCAGKVITGELRQTLHGALCKLRDYENTGLSPEDVERVNNFSESQAMRLMEKLHEEQEKHRWILASERLPKYDRWVQVTVKQHRWISEFDNEELPDEEKIDHPERIYCTLGRCLSRTTWEYAVLEAGDESVWTSLTDDCSVERLGYPMTEVIAWMPLPEVYREDDDER
ncbi:hypothetical protein [Brotaphodocola sp.]|uniref:hypothetical protein n=1 Tax=Brotaphodocola sp. TaxID=3073577 RepID=UPI003D7E96D0